MNNRIRICRFIFTLGAREFRAILNALFPGISGLMAVYARQLAYYDGDDEEAFLTLARPLYRIRR